MIHQQDDLDDPKEAEVLADPVTEVPSITTTAALTTDKTQTARHVVYAHLSVSRIHWHILVYHLLQTHTRGGINHLFNTDAHTVVLIFSLQIIILIYVH